MTEGPLSVFDVAKLMGRSVGSLQRLRWRDRTFPAPTVKRCRERLWEPSAVKEWIDAQTVQETRSSAR